MGAVAMIEHLRVAQLDPLRVNSLDADQRDSDNGHKEGDIARSMNRIPEAHGYADRCEGKTELYRIMPLP